MTTHPRLRDQNKLKTNELYSLGNIPDDIIRKIAGSFVYLIHCDRKDMTGDDWGDAFAKAIGGHHLASPLGIADVIYKKMAWSVKTVKAKNPFKQKNVRLISGRCSPDFSYGITDPHKDIQATGTAVLGIWNERINIATDNYNPVRTIVLVRSNDLLSYVLFEEDAIRYPTNNFKWSVNKNGNLIATDKTTKNECFTWQPHGAQFTIHTSVPANAIKFTIKKPPILSEDSALRYLEFDDSWVEIIR